MVCDIRSLDSSKVSCSRHNVSRGRYSFYYSRHVHKSKSCKEFVFFDNKRRRKMLMGTDPSFIVCW